MTQSNVYYILNQHIKFTLLLGNVCSVTTHGAVLVYVTYLESRCISYRLYFLMAFPLLQFLHINHIIEMYAYFERYGQLKNIIFQLYAVSVSTQQGRQRKPGYLVLGHYFTTKTVPNFSPNSKAELNAALYSFLERGNVNIKYLFSFEWKSKP